MLKITNLKLENLSTLRGGKGFDNFLCRSNGLSIALEAAKKLEAENILCSVVNMHTIKPLDKAAIKKACEKSH